MGISLGRELRLERSALRRLTGAGARGLCNGGSASSAVAAVAGLLDSVSEGAASLNAAGAASNGGIDRTKPAPPASGGVLGQTSASPELLFDEEGLEAAPEAILLLVLLGLGSAAAAILGARRLADRASAAVVLDPPERPILFLDIDGVIALDPWVAELPSGEPTVVESGTAYVSDRTGELLRTLASRFELVWATGWEHRANTSFQTVLGLEEHLPVLTFGKKARAGSSEWKIKAVNRYAGQRPMAWIDDNFVLRHERWALHRSARLAPTLLVPADPRHGICREHVDRLLKWADRVAPVERQMQLAKNGGNGEGGIRTLEGRYRP